MNNLTGARAMDTSNLTPIEIALGIDEKGMTTAKKLYEFLEMDKSHYSRWVKSNITDNQFADEKIDYWALATDGEREFNPNPTQDFKLTAHFAKKLSMTQKNKRGEDAREYFTKAEDKLKEVVINRMQLSPELQMFMQMGEAMANQELEQKRQAKEQERQAIELNEVKENQKTIVQALGGEIQGNFRSWVKTSLAAIAENENFQYIGSREERYQAVYTESYERLTSKRPCKLNQRVANERSRAMEAGASQSMIKGINKISIIESDKDLKPVYESVIREMLVFYCIEVK
ncbi:MAG: toxin Bro [Hungatella sp.]|nr:toxin Bro [Hungatella sp.]